MGTRIFPPSRHDGFAALGNFVWQRDSEVPAPDLLAIRATDLCAYAAQATFCRVGQIWVLDEIHAFVSAAAAPHSFLLVARTALRRWGFLCIGRATPSTDGALPRLLGSPYTCEAGRRNTGIRR